MEETILKSYEIGYLVKNEDGAEAVIRELKRQGAQILFDGEVKNIKLAYPIGHFSSAYFGYTHFKIDPELISNLKNTLKLDNQITRFLIITPPFAKDRSSGPESVPAQPRRATRPKIEASVETAVSNDLLEEKLEEILNK